MLPLTTISSRSGGHSLLAVRLTARIRKEFGGSLSLGDLLQHPSVAGLARLLRSEPQARPSSPLVTLREGGDVAPLFLVHPIGGSVYCYQALAAALGSDRPILGIESPALSGFLREEDLVTSAEAYVKIMRTRQAEGPYRLAGWSFGGLLAFEMARVLEGDGQKVDFLGLIDPSFPSEAEREFFAASENTAAAFVRDFAVRGGGEAGFSARFYRELLPNRRLEYLVTTLQKNGAAPLLDAEEIESLFEIFQANSRAIQSYHPGPYGGALSLFVAEDFQLGNRRSSAAWAKLCPGNIEIELLPGNHYSIMDPDRVERLAAGMLREMGRSEQRKPEDGREPALRNA